MCVAINKLSESTEDDKCKSVLLAIAIVTNADQERVGWGTQCFYK